MSTIEVLQVIGSFCAGGIFIHLFGTRSAKIKALVGQINSLVDKYVDSERRAARAAETWRGEQIVCNRVNTTVIERMNKLDKEIAFYKSVIIDGREAVGVTEMRFEELQGLVKQMYGEGIYKNLRDCFTELEAAIFVCRQQLYTKI